MIIKNSIIQWFFVNTTTQQLKVDTRQRREEIQFRGERMNSGEDEEVDASAERQEFCSQSCLMKWIKTADLRNYIRVLTASLFHEKKIRRRCLNIQYWILMSSGTTSSLPAYSIILYVWIYVQSAFQVRHACVLVLLCSSLWVSCELWTKYVNDQVTLMWYVRWISNLVNHLACLLVDIFTVCVRNG